MFISYEDVPTDTPPSARPHSAPNTRPKTGERERDAGVATDRPNTAGRHGDSRGRSVSFGPSKDEDGGGVRGGDRAGDVLLDIDMMDQSSFDEFGVSGLSWGICCNKISPR